MSKIRSQQSECKAKHRVTDAGQNISVEEQPVILMHECRKGGKTAAKAHCQGKPHIMIHDGPSFEKSVQCSKYQTAENIHRQCPPWQRRSEPHVHAARNEISGHAADKTPDSDKQQRSYHLSRALAPRKIRDGENPVFPLRWDSNSRNAARKFRPRICRN